MVSSPEVFLFDLDGTIIDSSEPQLEALARLLKEEGRHPGSRDALLRFIGVPTEDVIAELFPDEASEPFMERLAGYERQNYDQLAVHDGVLEVLAQVNRIGIPVAVVTSEMDRELAETRDRVDLEEWVSLWVTADDVLEPKPDPAPVLLALEQLGFEPGQAIMIGDTVYDIKAGARAGTRTGAALWGSVNPDALLSEKPDYAFKKPYEIVSQLLPGHGT